jgi:ABC-type transport system involved in multi-copper enzyme maturation permease subunit
MIPRFSWHRHTTTTNEAWLLQSEGGFIMTPHISSEELSNGRMTFLPIVGRELRVAARRRSTFWARTAVALGAIVIGIFFYAASLEATPQSVAQRIFRGLVVLCTFFCLFAGRLFTADCLSEEKREGTLGLLFLTDLKGYDIVLGKLAATSLNGFYGLLAVFPVLGVPILLGGISPGEFWRVVLVLANTFLFSLAVGIFVSALSRDARRAMGANLLLLLFIICIPGGCAAALYLLSSQQFHPELLFSCPFFSLYLCDDSVYRWRQTHFWSSVAVLHCLTWFLLIVAGWIVRHSWQDRPAGPRQINLRDLWHSWSFGPASKRARFRTHLLNINAFYWLAGCARLKPVQVWVVLLFVAGWWLRARLQLGSMWLDESTNGTNLATAIILNVALKLWVALEACHPLAGNRQAGSFELLLPTRLTVREVLLGQWLALRRQFLAPALLSADVALLFMIAAVQHSLDDHGMIIATWLSGICLFVADVTALGWAAMYSALTTRTPYQAAVSAISRILIAPWIVLIAIIVLANVFASISGTPEPRPAFYVAWWLGLGLATDLIYGLSARRQLLTRFRHLACHGARKRDA